MATREDNLIINFRKILLSREMEEILNQTYMLRKGGTKTTSENEK